MPLMHRPACQRAGQAPAQSCVSSRVLGLQEASLLLQLFWRLWALLGTWARGSQRMRYLRVGRGSWVSMPPPHKAASVWAGCPGWRCPHGSGTGTYTMSLGSSLVSGGGLMRT